MDTQQPSIMTDGSGRRFERVRALGSGGFGEVYLCRMRSPGGLEQQVAVKLLHQGLDPRSQAVERLRDEARLLASLRHPVVLAAHDLVELGGRVALVTEYIEGQDLSACLDPADPGRMPTSTLLEVIEQTAGALEVAWRQLEVVHRDVKPANIRIGEHGSVKLLDFGIARSTQVERDAHTSSQMLVGSLPYMGPERFRLGRRPEPASDVFSLGAILYEGAAGRSLLAGLELPEQIRLSLVQQEWEAFVRARLAAAGALPGPLLELIEQMLAHDLERRPGAAEVAARCEAMACRWPGHVPLRRWCRQRRWAEGSPGEVHGTLWQAPSPTATPGRPPLARSTTSGSLVQPLGLALTGAALTALVTGTGGLALVLAVSVVLALLLGPGEPSAPPEPPAPVLTLPPPRPAPAPQAPAPVVIAPAPRPALPPAASARAVDALTGWPSLPFGTAFDPAMRVSWSHKGVDHVEPADAGSPYLGMRVDHVDVQFVGGVARAVTVQVPPDAPVHLQALWGAPTSAQSDQMEWRGQRVTAVLYGRKLTVGRL
jgi:serine/threonine protein kinase